VDVDVLRLDCEGAVAVALSGEVLLAGRDSRGADEHARTVAFERRSPGILSVGSYRNAERCCLSGTGEQPDRCSVCVRVPVEVPLSGRPGVERCQCCAAHSILKEGWMDTDARELLDRLTGQSEVAKELSLLDPR